jgi:hypothetical protein
MAGAGKSLESRRGDDYGSVLVVEYYRRGTLRTAEVIAIGHPFTRNRAEELQPLLIRCPNGPSEALPRHLPEAATAVYAAARHESRWWTCSMDYHLDGQSGLRCPISTCGRAGPIPHICSAGAFGTVDEAAAARVRAGERSSFDRSALSAVSVHYVDDVRRPGIGGSARLGHATSIPSPGDGTSPTGAFGGHSGPRWASRASSRGQIRVWTAYSISYPSYSTVGPVAVGPRGRG